MSNTWRLNDGSSRPPRLVVYGNDWGLSELPQRPSDVTWSFDDCLERIAAAGFDGCQASLDKADRVRTFGLRFCAGGRVNVPAEADPVLHAAADAGAECVAVHAGWGMESDAEADAIVAALLDASARRSIPVYVETHRATLAQDVWRTCRLAERWPELRFNGDFSHYYCGQEMGYRGFDVSRRYLDPIVARTAFIHARISDGQCMQIDVGDGRSNPHAANFVSLWTAVMRTWLVRAGPGDVLPFVPELGPPSSGYSVCSTTADGTVVERSDRWAQTLVLRRLGQEAFAAAGQ